MSDTLNKTKLLESLDEEIYVYSPEDGINPEFDKGVLYLANKLKAVINLRTYDDNSQANEIDAIPALNEVILAQAKEIAKITEYRDEWQKRGLKAAHDYVAIKKQLELAVKVLEWYADKETYKVRGSQGFREDIYVFKDNGERARSTLLSIQSLSEGSVTPSVNP